MTEVNKNYNNTTNYQSWNFYTQNIRLLKYTLQLSILDIRRNKLQNTAYRLKTKDQKIIYLQ